MKNEKLNKTSFDFFDKVDLGNIADLARHMWRDNAAPTDISSDRWIAKCYAEAVLTVAINKGKIDLCTKFQKEQDT